jgi:hypothetical protein
MAARTLRSSLFLLCAVTAGACAETLDVPAAPELEDVLDAYTDPTAEISSTIMAAAADQLLELQEQLQDSDVFDEILEVIEDVQVTLEENTDENGDLFVPGLGTFPDPNAVLEINHQCPGWEPNDADGTTSDTEAGGSVGLTMVLNLGDIQPVVWGAAEQCQFSATVGDSTLRSSYDGGIAVHFGEEPPPLDEDPPPPTVITFVVEGIWEVEGRRLPIRRSFRLVGEEGLEILWELDDGTSFVYLFNLATLSQGIRDVNCTGDEGCSCNFEERECDLGSETISW